jgi:hypothetical protein
MWTTKDQIQAYAFLRRRHVSALLTGDANHPASPSRRLVLGYLVGVACAVLAVVGAAIVGLLRPH